MTPNINDRSHLWWTERAHDLEKTFLKETLLKEKTIDAEDLNLFHHTDDPAEAIAIIRKTQQRVQ